MCAPETSLYSLYLAAVLRITSPVWGVELTTRVQVKRAAGFSWFQDVKQYCRVMTLRLGSITASPCSYGLAVAFCVDPFSYSDRPTDQKVLS